MKKIFSMLAVVMAMCALTACGGGNTPSSAVSKAYDAFIDKDYPAFVDCLAGSENATEKERQEMLELIEWKGQASIEENGGIASYEILSEEIAEDGQSAVVKAKITYGDGKVKEEKSKVVKNADGDWKLSLDK